MLNLKDVTDLINEHAETIGEELMAALGERLLEMDIPVDTTELDSIKAELEAERAGRAEDKKSYLERINKFIYGGDPGPGPEPEKNEETDVVEETDTIEVEDLYEELYGGDE